MLSRLNKKRNAMRKMITSLTKMLFEKWKNMTSVRKIFSIKIFCILYVANRLELSKRQMKINMNNYCPYSRIASWKMKKLLVNTKYVLHWYLHIVYSLIDTNFRKGKRKSIGIAIVSTGNMLFEKWRTILPTTKVISINFLYSICN